MKRNTFVVDNYTLTTAEIRAADTTGKTLREMFPDAFNPELKPGDIVEKIDDNDGPRRCGVVAGPTVSQLVNAHFGYGSFVIVAGTSFSYENAGIAAKYWRKLDI